MSIAHPIRLFFFVLALSIGLPGVAPAAEDTALGTFTVNGKTVILKYVRVVRYTHPDRPTQHTLVIVGSDAPLAPEDLRGTTMVDRAKAGTLRAVRIEWHEGFDGLVTIPYHPDVADSGEPTEGGASIDLQRYDEKRLEALFKSRMVGQDWQFSVRARAAVVDGGLLEARTAVLKTVVPATPGGGDAVERKKRLAVMGYEFTLDEFRRAVQDGNVEAVDLFLGLGMNANDPGRDHTPVLVAAAVSCGDDPKSGHVQVMASLLKAGAKPDSADENHATALLWAAQHCSLDAVKLLIDAGADVNAKAKGGGTPLMLAEVLQRTNIAAALKAAGAR